MPSIEHSIMWFGRYELKEGILKMMENGWDVLYTIPLPPIQTQPVYTNSASTTHVDQNGTIIVYTQSPPIQDPGIEVCFIKRNWEKDPCPRCSYPFPDPDRIDREA